MNVEDLKRDARGELPAYAWPGGYPILYMTKSCAKICPPCASKDDTSDPALIGEVYWEGPPLNCEDCNAVIDSAYGDPEETESSRKLEAILSEMDNNVQA